MVNLFKKIYFIKGKASEIYDRLENKCIQMISEIISKKKTFKKQKKTNSIRKEEHLMKAI